MRSSFSRTALKDTSFSRLRISEAERGELSVNRIDLNENGIL